MKEYHDSTGELLKDGNTVILLNKNLGNIYEKLFTVNLKDDTRHYPLNHMRECSLLPPIAVAIGGPHIFWYDDNEAEYEIIPLSDLPPEEILLVSKVPSLEESYNELIKGGIFCVLSGNKIPYRIWNKNSFNSYCNNGKKEPASVGLPGGTYEVIEVSFWGCLIGNILNELDNYVVSPLDIAPLLFLLKPEKKESENRIIVFFHDTAEWNFGVVEEGLEYYEDSGPTIFMEKEIGSMISMYCNEPDFDKIVNKEAELFKKLLSLGFRILSINTDLDTFLEIDKDTAIKTAKELTLEAINWKESENRIIVFYYDTAEWNFGVVVEYSEYYEDSGPTTFLGEEIDGTLSMYYNEPDFDKIVNKEAELFKKLLSLGFRILSINTDLDTFLKIDKDTATKTAKELTPEVINWLGKKEEVLI